jgi:GTP cyclohydrolase I
MNRANQTLPDLSPQQVSDIEAEVAVAFQGVLNALRIDTANDHNTRETASRVAKMYVREVFKGRFSPPPNITDFANVSGHFEPYTLGPIAVRSACSHHFVPITGKLWVGVIPGDRVIGISKFSRLADWVLSRPHIQEEAIEMLADELWSRIHPRGLAILMDAQHQCMVWRGVKEAQAVMTSQVYRGEFASSEVARRDFLQHVRGTR